MSDDDFEGRLRRALSQAREGDATDSDDFLARVHHGAKVRRVKRGVGIAAAGVLAVAGGGLVINASGLVGGTDTPVAADHTTSSSTGGTTSTDPATISTSGPTQAKSPAETRAAPQTVTISPAGPISASEVHPLSLTATGTDKQWVLAETPGRDCDRASCATVFTTGDHAESWTDLGQLPAPPATSDTATSDTVSQVRFSRRTDGSGTYDGWVYGNALWSTHNSGRTWSNASSPAGDVTQLEAWGDYVYAGVSSPVDGDDTATLYRSIATKDSWLPVPVTGRSDDGVGDFTSVQSLAAAKDVVGLIDSGSGVHPAVYVSTDGITWQREHPCDRDTNARALSMASDPVNDVETLWVTCQGLSQAVVRLTDTSDLGQWSSVSDDILPPAVMVAAQSTTVGYAAGDGVSGIQRVSTTSPAKTVSSAALGTPVFFGFTNDDYGYLLDDAGRILSTIDGGASWAPYTVTDTP